MSEIEKKWYVVRAVSGQEKRVKETIETEVAAAGLQDYVGQVLIPIEKVFQIRKGKKVDNPVRHASGYIDYIKEYFDTKVFPKVKSEKGKQVKTDQMNSIISDTKKNLQVIKNCLILHNHLVDAKMMIVDKLNNGAKKFPSTFVRTNSGYKVVNDEGYVAIDKMSGGAVKLVDRLEFSYNNFNGIKNWDK